MSKRRVSNQLSTAARFSRRSFDLALMEEMTSKMSPRMYAKKARPTMMANRQSVFSMKVSGTRSLAKVAQQRMPQKSM